MLLPSFALLQREETALSDDGYFYVSVARRLNGGGMQPLRSLSIVLAIAASHCSITSAEPQLSGSITAKGPLLAGALLSPDSPALRAEGRSGLIKEWFPYTSTQGVAEYTPIEVVLPNRSLYPASGPIEITTRTFTAPVAFESRIGTLNASGFRMNDGSRFSANFEPLVNVAANPVIDAFVSFELHHDPVQSGSASDYSFSHGWSLSCAQTVCSGGDYLGFAPFYPEEREALFAPQRSDDSSPYSVRIDVDVTAGLQTLNTAELNSLGWSGQYDMLLGYAYTPHSWPTYAAIEFGLALNNNYSDASDIANVLDVAASQMSAIRKFGPVTSAQNLEARDAEYCLIGLQGGWINNGNFYKNIKLSSLDIEKNIEAEGQDYWGARGGPFAWLGYNAFKALDKVTAALDETGKNFGVDINLSTDITTGDLPSSPIGGLGANTSCWFAGSEIYRRYQKQGEDPRQSIYSFFTIAGALRQKIPEQYRTENVAVTTSSQRVVFSEPEQSLPVTFDDSEWIGSFYRLDVAGSVAVDVDANNSEFNVIQITDGDITAITVSGGGEIGVTLTLDTEQPIQLKAANGQRVDLSGVTQERVETVFVKIEGGGDPSARIYIEASSEVNVSTVVALALLDGGVSPQGLPIWLLHQAAQSDT